MNERTQISATATLLNTAKQRLSAAAARLLAGDRGAIAEANEATNEIKKLRAATVDATTREDAPMQSRKFPIFPRM